jgi:hypothetical protein
MLIPVAILAVGVVVVLIVSDRNYFDEDPDAIRTENEPHSPMAT